MHEVIEARRGASGEVLHRRVVDDEEIVAVLRQGR
jgi:hypothetical protein